MVVVVLWVIVAVDVVVVDVAVVAVVLDTVMVLDVVDVDVVVVAVAVLVVTVRVVVVVLGGTNWFEYAQHFDANFSSLLLHVAVPEPSPFKDMCPLPLKVSHLVLVHTFLLSRLHPIDFAILFWISSCVQCRAFKLAHFTEAVS